MDKPSPDGGVPLNTILLPAIILWFSLGAPAYLSGQPHYSRQVKRVRSDLVLLNKTIQIYESDTGRLPKCIHELLSRDPRTGKGPWIEEMGKDPWGHDYYYLKGHRGPYNLVSFGADGKLGGKNEDRDWDLHDFKE